MHTSSFDKVSGRVRSLCMLLTVCLLLSWILQLVTFTDNGAFLSSLLALLVNVFLAKVLQVTISGFEEMINDIFKTT